MANADILKIEEELMHFSIFDLPTGEGVKSRGQLIERKIEALEKLAGKVSNRRSRRWLNDRLLIELVPRLKVEEIRGLFAPPPWGESTPLSAFCMTNVGEWDVFRNVDMDKEARLIEALEKTPSSRKESVEKDKLVALNAWYRVDCRSREAFRHNLLSELVENYEEQIQAFIKNKGDEDVLKLHVQNPFHRLLLHGVCEYYNLISATETTKNSNLLKVTKIKKKAGSKQTYPAISLSQFLKISKNGSL
ncbi:hypothetical protein IEQ34_006477 [Dendrobium chrysotoxum]|uniref:R3H domain-containing protein n=1 Tax=Dendrobium chrysotoxum TaxID=161865 RepID=A0AAV7HE78_DENCH|nr:hypothetical protein IEQ34_006477 [Dendrobium chrysotoxum]